MRAFSCLEVLTRMSKKSPRVAPSSGQAPPSERLPVLTGPEAITLLLEGVMATAFTSAEPVVGPEVRMLAELEQDLLGAVDVWPRLESGERQGVTEALAEHLGRLDASGWALSGARQEVDGIGPVLRFHALRQPPTAAGVPRGLLH
jgi:hypothetical protein